MYHNMFVDIIRLNQLRGSFDVVCITVCPLISNENIERKILGSHRCFLD